MNDITCMVPTHNRSHFLRRLLLFLEQTKAEFPLLIVDSSRPDFRLQNEAMIRSAERTLDIQYRHIDQSFVTKCRIGIDSIDTPLTFCCADDDFPITAGVTACADFLRSNPDYLIAQGAKLSFCTTKGLYALHGYSLSHDSAMRRFRQFAGHWFCTLFAMYRTETLQYSFRVTDAATSYDRARVFPELMWTHMGILQGRLKHLQVPYNIREEHSQNESTVVPEIADQEHCSELYADFHTAMAREIARQSGATLDHARVVVDACYGYLLSGGNAKDRSTRGRVKRELKRHWRRLVDTFNRDQILQRRRIDVADPLFSSSACHRALELIQQFPHGIEEQSAAAA